MHSMNEALSKVLQSKLLTEDEAKLLEPTHASNPREVEAGRSEVKIILCHMERALGQA